MKARSAAGPETRVLRKIALRGPAGWLILIVSGAPSSADDRYGSWLRENPKIEFANGNFVRRSQTETAMMTELEERWQHLAAFFARVGVEVEEGSAGQTGLFAHPYALFSVTWRLSARLPVRREDYSTDLRQTGQRLEPGCSERRGRDG
jgi:hypothetical protein